MIEKGKREVTFRIVEHIGVIDTQDNGWSRELNMVSWQEGPAKFDIRAWSPDHERMTRGITLREHEAEKLAQILAEHFGIKEK